MRNLSSVVAEIKSGKTPGLLLLFGDDLQVREACKTIVNLLVPENQRGFNFERFDARAASWDQIEASLMTPPFIPGKKVLWAESVPYFVTREQKGELGANILQLWSEGERDAAAKLLLDLLVVEGWTPEQWQELEPAACGPVLGLLGAEDQEARSQTEALIAYSKSQGIELGARKPAGGQRLLELLDQGLPEWDLLLLSALHVDRRSRLFKRFEECGAAVYLGLERDRSGKVSRDALSEFIDGRLKQAAKILEPRAREMILNRSGDELRALDQELEKLFLYTGERRTIGAEDIEAVFADQGEGWIFDLTRAIADRDGPAALGQLNRLLTGGDHPLKILGTIAGEVRRLLGARQLIDGQLRGAWKRGMSFQQFKQHVLVDGAPVLTRNPYADFMCFDRAEGFGAGELRAYMERIFDADMRLKSSAGNPRLVMERLVLGMCLGAGRKADGQLGAAT